MMTLTGTRALAHASKTGAALNKYADPTEGARFDLDTDEADEIASVDAGLIWCEFTATDAMIAEGAAMAD